jgi:CubicO group peptidase (beta-lactamase class C family)
MGVDVSTKTRVVGIIFACIITIFLGYSFFCKHGLGQRMPFFSSHFDAYITDVMNMFHIPGLAIAIVKDDDVVFIKGYGVREHGKSALVDAQTVFPIGSCSKAFTAAALGMLVDEGKIKWSDTVHTYIPDLQLYNPYVTKELMISDILSHRSGIEDVGVLYYRTLLSRAELVHRLRYLQPKVGFRVSGVYNNLMFLLAGQIIPAVTGKSWDEFISERFFAPLSMKESSTSTRALDGVVNLAQPHIVMGEQPKRIPFHTIDSVAPAGSINATITDMAQWVRMLVNEGSYNGTVLLKPETIHAMYSPESIMGKGHPYGLYGFGWGISDYHGHKIVSHKGSIDGMSAVVGLLPDKKVGVVILTNVHLGVVGPMIMDYVFDRYLRRRTAVESSPVALFAKKQQAELAVQKEHKEEDNKRLLQTRCSLELSHYVGTYHNELYGNVIITQKADQLWCNFLAFDGLLQHWQNDTFMFDSAIDYPAIADRFFFSFQIQKNHVDEVLLSVAGMRDTVFKKLKS